MKKKVLTLLVSGVLAVGTLAGCGSTQKAEDAAAEKPLQTGLCAGQRRKLRRGQRHFAVLGQADLRLRCRRDHHRKSRPSPP